MINFRRFLDVNLIGNLITYLEKLHDKNVATKDHTTLLLNCCTKLKDEERLLKFTALFANSNDEKAKNFDVEAAITTLYDSKCEEHAIKLALQYQRHDAYIKMQVSNLLKFIFIFFFEFVSV